MNKGPLTPPGASPPPIPYSQKSKILHLLCDFDQI